MIRTVLRLVLINKTNVICSEEEIMNIFQEIEKEVDDLNPKTQKLPFGQVKPITKHINVTDPDDKVRKRLRKDFYKVKKIHVKKMAIKAGCCIRRLCLSSLCETLKIL